MCPQINAEATSAVRTLNYKEAVLAEFPDVTGESEITRYMEYKYSIV